MIYNLIIALYTSAVRLAALFNKKVALMVKGEKESFGILEKQIVRGEKYLWFHAASLGEFEQGRPLIEEIRKTYPQYKILQTFFSPSGYEVRKNYKGADIVCYLPLDTPSNVKRFLDLAQLIWLLHQVRILAELFERTSTAKYSGLQCIFHLPERTDFLPLVWQKLPKGTEHVYSSVRTG